MEEQNVENTRKEKLNIVLDASKIDLFETCPERYNLRHNHNKGLPILQKAKALDLGGLAHEGFSVYFNLLKQGIKYDERLAEAKQKIYELSSNPDESNSEPEEVSALVTAVEQSCDYWRAEDENCLEILEVEQPFAYVIYEDDLIRIIISGKIDLLVNYHGIGRSASYDRLPMDHKTFSRESMLLRKSNQFINYCNAVESNYLVVNRVGLQKTVAAEQKFKRLPLSYDPVYIGEWKKNLVAMLTQEYLTCVSTGIWPEKPTSCNKFNRLCEYFDVCDTSGTMEDKMIKLYSNYVDVPEWDVTKNLTGVGNE